MRTFLRITVFGLAVALVAPAARAQAWRGMGRLAGTVTDDQGKPLEGVTITFDLPGSGGTHAKTDKKGEWALGGIARGAWHLDFEKPGSDTVRITVSVEELSRVPPIRTSLKASAPDPNDVIQAELLKGAGLLNEKKFPEARAIYEGILAKYPQAYQVEPLIARTTTARNSSTTRSST
jgi:hypothetical protein